MRKSKSDAIQRRLDAPQHQQRREQSTVDDALKFAAEHAHQKLSISQIATGIEKSRPTLRAHVYSIHGCSVYELLNQHNLAAGTERIAQRRVQRPRQILTTVDSASEADRIWQGYIAYLHNLEGER